MKKIILFFFVLLAFSPIVYAHDFQIGKSYRIDEESPYLLLDDFAVDEAGNVYICNVPHEKIQIYDKNGNFQFAIRIEIKGEFEVDVSQQNIFVTTFENNEIFEFDQNGVLQDIQKLKYDREYDPKYVYWVDSTMYKMTNGKITKTENGVTTEYIKLDFPKGSSEDSNFVFLFIIVLSLIIGGWILRFKILKEKIKERSVNK